MRSARAIVIFDTARQDDKAIRFDTSHDARYYIALAPCADTGYDDIELAADICDDCSCRLLGPA